MKLRTLERTHRALLDSLDLCLRQLSDASVPPAQAPEVSSWSVKDHLEHLSIANGGIVRWIERVTAGDTALDSGGRPTVPGRIVLLCGAFPRGRGKAPERTLPTGVSVDELSTGFRDTRQRVEALGASLAFIAGAGATRNHFVFGDLDAAQWIRFMVIHNHHHQKIIRDILAAAGPVTG